MKNDEAEEYSALNSNNIVLKCSFEVGVVSFLFFCRLNC